jgi:hypothetical protein
MMSFETEPSTTNIKRRVVGDDNATATTLLNLGPDINEGGSILHCIRCDAVDTDQVVIERHVRRLN